MRTLDTTAIRECWRDNGGNDDVVTLCDAVDVLAETLTEIADAGCSAGWSRCPTDGTDTDRGDWCDECTAADALERAGLR